MSFSGLGPKSDALPTMCSPYSDIIDKTKAARRVFSTVMARGPDSDEGIPRWVGRTRSRWFHDGINRFAYCTESPLDRVQRRRTHYP
jgi:hypothetical protein